MLASGQVSWLSDHPTPHAFPAELDPGQWLSVGFVPDHSDGVAADSHRLPWSPRLAGHPDALISTGREQSKARRSSSAPIENWPDWAVVRRRIVAHYRSP